MQTISSLIVALSIIYSSIARPMERNSGDILNFKQEESPVVEASGGGSPTCDVNRHQCLIRSMTQYFISADHDGTMQTSQDIRKKDYLQFSTVGMYYIKIQVCYTGNFFAVVDGALTTVQSCGDHIESSYCHWHETHTYKGTVFRNMATGMYLTVKADGTPTLSKESEKYKKRATFVIYECNTIL